MKTIAFFLNEPIKTNQRFIYNQIVNVTQYNTIVIGPFDHPVGSLFPLRNYFNLNKIADLGRFFKSLNVFAIHAHHGRHALYALPICQKYNIPLIVSIRGRDGSARPEIFNKHVKRYSTLVKEGALFLPVCEYLADGLLKLGFPKHKIHVLYGGIELDLFPFVERSLPASKEVRILSVGRLVEKKGFVQLIKAFKLIHSQYPLAKLDIIGSGEEEERLTSLIQSLDLENAVTLKGALHSEYVSEEMKKAHIFCLASHTSKSGDVEGIPNVLKEALAIGLPVVSTRHGGIPELIEHKKTGYLAQERSVLELAMGIKYFIEHPEVWSEYTNQGRKLIEEKFDINKQILEQQRLYSLIDK